MINRRNHDDVQRHMRYRVDVYRDALGTQDNRWSALRMLLIWADEALLSDATQIRPTFATFLLEQKRDGEHLAPSTLEGVVAAARSFFRWAVVAYPRRYRIPPLWIESLQAPEVPRVAETREYYTIDDLRQMVAFDDGSLRAERITAAAAMLFLSGMRAGAFVTLPICAVDLAAGEIRQWTALGVQTKRSKSATTYLLGIDDLRQIVARWDARVRGELDRDAMWYANLSENPHEPKRVEAVRTQSRGRAHGLRLELRWLCEQVGVPYLSPHHFRHGFTVHAEAHARTMADRKAISENLMHSNLGITDGVYGRLMSDDRRERVGRLGGQSECGDRDALIAQMESLLRQLKGDIDTE